MKRDFDEDKHDDKFQVGDLVAYYIGDRSAKLKTIRRRFSAPWKILDRLRHNVVKIQCIDNPKEILACHVSMLKKYSMQDFVPLTEILATQSEKDRIEMKQKEKQKRKRNKGKRKRKRKPLPKFDSPESMKLSSESSELLETSDDNE